MTATPLGSRTFPEPGGARALVLVLAGMLALCLVLYSNTLHSPFLFDGERLITENPHIRITSLDTSGLARILDGPGRTRPLSMASFALNYYVGGYAPVGWHLANIVLHALAGFLFFLLCKTTLVLVRQQGGGLPASPFWAALAASFIWLAHPVHVQAVTYIVQRMTILSGLFGFACVYAYARGRMQGLGMCASGPAGPEKKRWAWFGVCGLSMALALASKETAIVLPLLLFLYEGFFLQGNVSAFFRKYFPWLMGFCLVSGVVFLVVAGPQIISRQLYAFQRLGFTPLERFLTEARVLIWYLGVLAWPSPGRLCLDPWFSVSSGLLSPLSTLFSLALLFGLLAGGIKWAGRFRLAGFAVWWFVAALLPESTIVPLDLAFLHRIYLPCAFLFLVFSESLFQFMKSKKAAATLLCVAVAVLGFWTFQRNRVFSDAVTLWTDNVKKAPYKHRAGINLADAYFQAGMLAEAEAESKRILGLYPHSVDAWSNLGAVLAGQGRLEEAGEAYSAALTRAPDHVEALNGKGVILRATGKADQGEILHRRALAAEPENPQTLVFLGRALVDLGQVQEAREIFRQATQKDQGLAEAHYQLGNVLLNRGEFTAAANSLERALEIDGDFAQAHNSLGLVKKKTGDMERALFHFQKAVDLMPDYAVARSNLGGALAARGELKNALVQYRVAANADPPYAVANNGLGNVLWAMGRLGEAGEQYRKAIALDPHYVTAWVNLGRLLITLNKPEEAVPVLEKAWELHPGHPAVQTLLNGLKRGGALDSRPE